MHMRRLALALPFLAGTWAACGDDASSPPDEFGTDAGPDVAVPVPAVDAGLDCTKDLSADGVHRHLACTGLYTSLAAKTVTEGVRPYKPAEEFWSDGAQKQRWLWLPPGTKIDTTNGDEWTFPAGTKAWKEFVIGGKRIETRHYVKLDDGTWKHTTYRWNADESDATRKDIGEKIPGLGPDGGIYEVPASGACDDCHRGRTDQLLGIEAVNLGLPGATGLTLDGLAASGLLSTAPARTSLAFPGDATAKAAIAFLHTNCGGCHNGNPDAKARTRAHFLVRPSELTGTEAVTDLELYRDAWCKDGHLTEDDGTTYKYIRGGAPERSIASVLSGFRVPAGEDPDDRQMPPVVTRAVDVAGHAALDAWIRTLPPCL